MARQLNAAQRIVQLMEQIAKEEAWLDHYTRVGIAAPKVEENIANMRAELHRLMGEQS